MAGDATDKIAVLATIDPDAYTAAAYTSDWVDMRAFEQIAAIVMAGTLGSSATLDGKLQKATSSTGAGATDISGKSITQLTQAGTDSDKQAIINLKADELGAAASDGTQYTHVALVMTVGTATSDAGAIIIGVDPRNGPASGSDLSSVDEIVA